MRYYKQFEDNYIAAIGIGFGGEEIAESEYNEILSAVRSCPNEEGKGYLLRADLTWECFELPINIETENELSIEEAYNIIMGGGE